MGISQREGWIWFNGEWVNWPDAKIHVLTHSLHYGAGVFEGVRAYHTDKGTAIFRLQEHTRRLFDSAHILRMKIPFSQAELIQAQRESIVRNQLDAAYLRPIVFYGSEALGLQISPKLTVNVAIAAWPWGTYLGDGALEKGIRVKTSSYTRHHVNISMCKAKATGNYINSILAHQEVAESGYDEALLLDSSGYVAEGSGENFFMIRKGQIITPDLAACLEGITRDTVITLAKEAGYEIIERRITRDEVYVADEAFFTGTAAEVTPIRELDNRQLGNGEPGPITKLLQKQYFDSVYGRSNVHPEWLTLVQ